MARAMLANAKAGKVAQGGSTITQQLVKNRDLTPKRSVGRKASEAVRALALEVEHDKRDILDAYLDQLYLGHVEGLAIHGLGTAARVYFSKDAGELTLPEATLLAAMIQGPNRLSPIRHPQRAIERRNWVLGRMAELGWSSTEEVERARAAALGLDLSPPERSGAVHFLDWVASTVEGSQSRRLERGRGLVVETTLDPYLQMVAERVVESHLRELRRSHPGLRSAGLSAALVALDAASGAVLAYVGGDPADHEDRFDRARKARRQTGSTIKPLLLLDPFEDCGERKPLNPATRVADERLRIELPDGAWEPSNYGGRFHGVVDLRFALRHSLNVPFVRVVRWCGVEPTAERIRKTGLTLPPSPPLSFILGAVEASPLEMAGAYTVFASPGRVREPFGIRRIERPSGRRLASFDGDGRNVVHASSAYLIHELMRDAVAKGTGGRAAIEGLDVAGKTGTSSSSRDAWFIGDDGGIVAAVWIGLDESGSLGLTGGSAAAPLWKSFVELASPTRPAREVKRPRDIVVHRVDPATGLRLSPRSSKGREELFRRRALPRKDRFLRPDRPEAVIH
jgi:membrane peptidoglycan carboxypeptidase